VHDLQQWAPLVLSTCQTPPMWNWLTSWTTNNLCVAHIVVSTSQTPTPKSTDLHLSSTHWHWTCEMSWPQQLHMQKHIAFPYPCPQTLAPRSHHHLGRGAKTISYRTWTMTWRWGHDFQVEWKKNRMWEMLLFI